MSFNLSIKQKKIKVQSKKYYVILLLLGNNIIRRLGYIVPLKKHIVVRVDLNTLYKYLVKYESVIHINNQVYLKFFILFYFYLINFKKIKNFK